MALARKQREQEQRRKAEDAVKQSSATKRIVALCKDDPRFRSWFLEFLRFDGVSRKKKLGEFIPEMRRRGLSEGDMWVLDSLGVEIIAKALLVEIELVTPKEVGRRPPAGNHSKAPPEE